MLAGEPTDPSLPLPEWRLCGHAVVLTWRPKDGLFRAEVPELPRATAVGGTRAAALRALASTLGAWRGLSTAR